MRGGSGGTSKKTSGHCQIPVRNTSKKTYERDERTERKK